MILENKVSQLSKKLVVREGGFGCIFSNALSAYVITIGLFFL